MEKETKMALIIGTAAITTTAVISAMAGCNLDTLIQVEIPPVVAETVTDDAEDTKITLEAAQYVRSDWIDFVERVTLSLDNAIYQGQETRATIEAIIDTGMEHVGVATSTLPYGGLITSMLGFGTGLFLRRPGDKKRAIAAVDEAFASGLAGNTTESDDDNG